MMKKIALLLSILMVTVIIAAQGSPIDKLFNKYSGNDGFTTVLVNQDMFEIISKMEKSEGDIEGDIGGVMGNIKKVRVLAQEDEEGNTKGINFMDEAFNLIGWHAFGVGNVILSELSSGFAVIFVQKVEFFGDDLLAPLFQLLQATIDFHGLVLC